MAGTCMVPVEELRSASRQVIPNACYRNTSRHWSGSVERPMGYKRMSQKREKNSEFTFWNPHGIQAWVMVPRNAVVRVDVQGLKPGKL